MTKYTRVMLSGVGAFVVGVAVFIYSLRLELDATGPLHCGSDCEREMASAKRMGDIVGISGVALAVLGIALIIATVIVRARAEKRAPATSTVAVR